MLDCAVQHEWGRVRRFLNLRRYPANMRRKPGEFAQTSAKSRSAQIHPAPKGKWNLRTQNAANGIGAQFAQRKSIPFSFSDRSRRFFCAGAK